MKIHKKFMKFTRKFAKSTKIYEKCKIYEKNTKNLRK